MISAIASKAYQILRSRRVSRAPPSFPEKIQESLDATTWHAHQPLSHLQVSYYQIAYSIASTYLLYGLLIAYFINIHHQSGRVVVLGNGKTETTSNAFKVRGLVKYDLILLPFLGQHNR